LRIKAQLNMDSPSDGGQMNMSLSMRPLKEKCEIRKLFRKRREESLIDYMKEEE